MASKAQFSLALDVRCELGECPCWDTRESVLWFTDIVGKRLHRYDAEAGTDDVLEAPEEIGCFAPTADGDIVAGMRSGIWLLSSKGKPARMLAGNPEEARTHRFNDGGTDPRGRFWLGTMDATKKEANAHLYRFDRRGLAAVEGGLLTSNGVAFSPDGQWMYHSDTPRRKIYRYAYDVDAGEATERRIFVDIAADPTASGGPDGGAVDAEGCYWTALYGGGVVRRYSPDGNLLGEHAVPARCPTMPAFGGADMKTLFVTTACDGRSASELSKYPLSGSLFRMPVDVPGLVKPAFDPNA